MVHVCYNLLQNYSIIAFATISTTDLSSAFGITMSSRGSFTALAKAFAALSFISSVICFFPEASTPLKIPGNESTLLIWFGISDRPVPQIRAQPARASSGMISGVGLAIPKIMESFAMVATCVLLITFGAESPMKTSAPTRASDSVPSWFSRFVIVRSHFFESSKSFLF